MKTFMAIVTGISAVSGSYMFYAAPNMTPQGRNMTILGMLLPLAALIFVTALDAVEKRGKPLKEKSTDRS